jgi:hypothetical protein
VVQPEEPESPEEEASPDDGDGKTGRRWGRRRRSSKPQ